MTWWVKCDIGGLMKLSSATSEAKGHDTSVSHYGSGWLPMKHAFQEMLIDPFVRIALVSTWAGRTTPLANRRRRLGAGGWYHGNRRDREGRHIRGRSLIREIHAERLFPLLLTRQNMDPQATTVSADKTVG